MSVGFGVSFGDLVTGIEVIIDIVAALKDSGGASAAFRELMTELYSLETALIAVKGCNLQETSREYEAARQAVGECQACISKFLVTVNKYQQLSAGHVTMTARIRAGHNPLKEQILKIKWATCHSEDVDRFRAKLSTRIGVLNLLLSAIQLTRMTIADTETSNKLDEQSKLIVNIHERLGKTDTEHIQLLQKIELLVTSPPTYEATAAQLDFEVRPVRLTGAPIAPDHVDRMEVMHSIETALLPISEGYQNIIVLQGMGGIGKSQLARSFATKHQRDYTAIFWLNAKTERSLSFSIAQLSEQIPIPEVLDKVGQLQKDDSEIDVARKAVIKWLSHKGNTRWLLVLDNVDSQLTDSYDENRDSTEAPGSSGLGFDAYKYIPQVLHGSILITSRLSFLGRIFGATVVRVDEMSLDEGTRLLCKVSRRMSDEGGIKALVQRLGAHPLALSQAGRLIFETQMSPTRYLQQYDVRFKALLKTQPGMREYHNGSIMATLGLSYDRLMTRNPSAAALLILCGYLDNSSLNYDLFAASSNAKDTVLFIPEDPPRSPRCSWIADLSDDWLRDICEEEDCYLSCISSLHELSFIRHNDTSDSVSLHPLIHEWSLYYGSSMINQDVLGATCNILAATVPQSDPEVIGLPYSQIQPHADRWYSMLPRDHAITGTTTNSILALSVYYLVQGPVERASVLRKAAYNNAKSRFGARHRCTMEAQITIGVGHFDAGEFKEALEVFEVCRADYSRIDWEPSLNREENEALANLMTESHLTLCYKKLNRMEEAAVHMRALEALKNDLVGTSVYAIISWLYFVIKTALCIDEEEEEEQQRIEDSIRAGEDLLRMVEETKIWPPSFGSREWALANMCSVLGTQYISQGEVEKGRAFLKRSLGVYERTQGPSAPDTLAVTKEYLNSGAIPSAPLIMRNSFWRSAVMDVLAKATKDTKMDISHTVHTPPEVAHAGLTHIYWLETLTTVRQAVKNRPQS